MLLLCSAGHAGMVKLYNGDQLEGDFVRLDGDKLVWSSKNFGEVKISRTNIQNLNTTMPMKISGSDTPCLIDGMKQEHLFYSCGGDPQQRSAPLAALDIMLPFESHIDGEYTFNGKFSLSGFFAKGNDVRRDIKVKTQAEYRRSEFRHNALLEYASYSSDRQAPDEVWSGRYSLDWFFRERWFWTNDLTLGADEARAIAEYYSLGSGTGYQFWENTQTAFALTAGFTYLNERYEIPDVPADDFEVENERVATRLGTDFRYKLPLGIAFFHNNSLVSSLEDDQDWRLSSNTGLSTMIAGELYSELKVDYSVDNLPQQDTKREDTRLMVGVSYEW
ncbi:DUF481 domain-containing protein [Gilvimarinus agarilyticus]|uniref:DUF481 domain-containing protein n=1 Tax=unclassified Gilvimarinus TaxID=2642066 RepID=UPI001C083160|nr:MULTISPECIES: DUF481 domain-containing protein [unclassified Gilvimarinus]MBU2886913.1 DUF481 domain-containing protein [Gilvimarinus agarilyticus]MDO6571574.1 DUF481 domain-containing protein [Gilvimarinus sp. 2_MG-2023]MDO6747903.1 DUF481 domain-containing protein [Gilvimarinus sp. 1_MG-2023]